jgi:hypothetical protein
MKRQSKCDLKGGWPECWNTECRWHGKAAKRWHEIRKRIADERMTREESRELRAEEKTLYEQLTREPGQK